MRLVFLILIFTSSSTTLLVSQDDVLRSKNKKSQVLNKENKPQKASPRIPSVEELLKKSQEGKPLELRSFYQNFEKIFWMTLLKN